MTENPTQFDRENWAKGADDFPKLPGESTAEYLERWKRERGVAAEPSDVVDWRERAPYREEI